MKVDIVIVGGGLAGLLAAARLRMEGLDDFLVLERGGVGGGAAQTVSEEGYQLETAVATFRYPGRDLGPILDAAKVGVDPMRGAGRRFVFDDSRLHEIRPGPAAIRSDLVSLSEKIRLLAEPVLHGSNPEHDESLQNFMIRHFGRRLGARASWLIASGIFAGDPSQLSAAAVMPGLKQIEKTHSSLLIGALKARKSRSAGVQHSMVPRGGMTTLADSLVGFIGDRFIPDCEVVSVEPGSDGDIFVSGSVDIRANHVVLTCAPKVAAGLVGDEELIQTTKAIEFAPVVVAGLGAKRSELPIPDGFGILVGKGLGMATRGVMLESSYAPHRAPEGNSLVRVIAGGNGVQQIGEASDEEILDRLTSEASAIFDTPISPSYARLIRHVPGIPQYRPGHLGLVGSIESSLHSMGRLYVGGWSYRGVGLSQLAADANRITENIRGHETHE